MWIKIVGTYYITPCKKCATLFTFKKCWPVAKVSRFLGVFSSTLLSALSAECWLTIAPPVSMWWHSCCERLSSLALLWMDSWKEETEGSCLVQAQLFYSQEADGITGRRVGRAWSLLCSASGASRPAWDPQGPRVCFSWQDSPWHFAGDPQQGLGSPSASRQEAFLLLPADLPWEQLGMSFLSAEGAPLCHLQSSEVILDLWALVGGFSPCLKGYKKTEEAKNIRESIFDPNRGWGQCSLDYL
jgi:hypothetical protein